MSLLIDGHATMLCSAVSSGRQVVHQSRRIFVGREVSSAAAAASQSSQSATVKDLPLGGMNKIGWFIKSKHRAGYTRCVPEQNRVVRRENVLGAVIGAVLRARTPKKRFGVLRAHKA